MLLAQPLYFRAQDTPKTLIGGYWCSSSYVLWCYEPPLFTPSMAFVILQLPPSFPNCRLCICPAHDPRRVRRVLRDVHKARAGDPQHDLLGVQVRVYGKSRRSSHVSIVRHGSPIEDEARSVISFFFLGDTPLSIMQQENGLTSVETGRGIGLVGREGGKAQLTAK